MSLTVLAGIAVANTYLLQPLLPQLAAAFADPDITSVVAALSHSATW